VLQDAVQSGVSRKPPFHSWWWPGDVECMTFAADSGPQGVSPDGCCRLLMILKQRASLLLVHPCGSCSKPVSGLRVVWCRIVPATRLFPGMFTIFCQVSRKRQYYPGSCVLGIVNLRAGVQEPGSTVSRKASSPGRAYFRYGWCTQAIPAVIAAAGFPVVPGVSGVYC
jgi:hypothetical protein